MTAREFIKKILEEAPDLDADIYISQPVDDIESESFTITNITNGGSNDAVDIVIRPYM